MTLTQYNIMRGEFQLTKTEVRILKFLLKNITKEFSIKSISNSIEITYPSVWESISSLKEKGVIKVREINPTQNLCSPDIKNSNNVSVFSYIEFLEKEDFFAKKQALKAIANDILKRIDGNSFTFMLFGSHVRSIETPSSDIDILLLIPTMKDEMRMMNSVAGAERLTNRKIHAVIMTYEDFFEPLKTEGTSLSREVLENHIIAYGAEAFYRALVLHG